MLATSPAIGWASDRRRYLFGKRGRISECRCKSCDRNFLCFKNGVISWENLTKIRDVVGKERLVLDLSCRKRDGEYYIVTDRWAEVHRGDRDFELMEKLGSYCDEFLVHAVDVEGKAHGVEKISQSFWDSIRSIR